MFFIFLNMHFMNIGGTVNNIDIKVLRAVYVTITSGSVTKASEILNVSPGSISYLLNKARRATGSALFFRTRSGMKPDNIAKELGNRYQRFTQEVLPDKRVSNLEHRELTVSTYALVEMMIGSGIENLAVHRKINFITLPSQDEQRQQMLRNREVDIDIGTRLPADSSIIQSSLFSSGIKIVAGKNNTHIKDGFDINDWLAAKHVIWSRGMHLFCDNHEHANRFHDYLDRRNVSCVASNTSNMIFMAAYTDHVVMMPEVITRYLEDKLPIRIFSPPEELDMQYQCFVNYHRSMANDPQIVLFLNSLRTIFG